MESELRDNEKSDRILSGAFRRRLSVSVAGGSPRSVAQTHFFLVIRTIPRGSRPFLRHSMLDFRDVTLLWCGRCYNRRSAFHNISLYITDNQHNNYYRCGRRYIVCSTFCAKGGTLKRSTETSLKRKSSEARGRSRAERESRRRQDEDGMMKERKPKEARRGRDDEGEGAASHRRGCRSWSTASAFEGALPPAIPRGSRPTDIAALRPGLRRVL